MMQSLSCSRECSRPVPSSDQLRVGIRMRIISSHYYDVCTSCVVDLPNGCNVSKLIVDLYFLLACPSIRLYLYYRIQ